MNNTISVKCRLHNNVNAPMLVDTSKGWGHMGTYIPTNLKTGL